MNEGDKVETIKPNFIESEESLQGNDQSDIPSSKNEE